MSSVIQASENADARKNQFGKEKPTNFGQRRKSEKTEKVKEAKTKRKMRKNEKVRKNKKQTKINIAWQPRRLINRLIICCANRRVAPRAAEKTLAFNTGPLIPGHLDEDYDQNLDVDEPISMTVGSIKADFGKMELGKIGYPS